MRAKPWVVFDFGAKWHVRKQRDTYISGYHFETFNEALTFAHRVSKGMIAL